MTVAQETINLMKNIINESEEGEAEFRKAESGGTLTINELLKLIKFGSFVINDYYDETNGKFFREKEYSTYTGKITTYDAAVANRWTGKKFRDPKAPSGSKTITDGTLKRNILDAIKAQAVFSIQDNKRHPFKVVN